MSAGASADRAEGTGEGMSVAPRRPLTYAVLLCLAGAALVLFAATRVWQLEVTVRPAPLPPIEQERSGGSLMPWLPALAVVALAGGGAMLATRGLLRRLLGGLLLVIGTALVAGGSVAATNPDVDRLWPLLCVLGGLAVAAAGAATAARGHRWPAMGARYERAAGTPPPAVSSRPERVEAAGTRDAWDALDRGEDPTAG